VLAILVLAGAGCGGPHLAREPRPAVDLAGHWVLDPTASDDAARIVNAALPKPSKRPTDDTQPPSMANGNQPNRTGGGHRGGRDSTSGNGQNSGSSAVEQPALPAWGKLGPGEFVRAFALPPARLDIAEQPALVVISQGERRRAFQPGDEEPVSVNDRFGSRSVQAGWDGADFVIDSTDGTRLKIVERYRQLPNDRLALNLEFRAQRVKTMRIQTVYRRATASELAAPTPDGPPSPGPR
jgi:hypothetical protein